MRPLEVDAFACGIRSDENFDGWIVLEGDFRRFALLAAHASVNGYDGIVTAPERTKAFHEIGERVAVFGEDYKLTATHMAVRKYVATKYFRQLRPLPIGVWIVTDTLGEHFEVPQVLDFGLQLLNGPRGRRFVDNLFGSSVRLCLG